MKSQELNYTVIFQKEPEGGYTAIVPSLPGCVTYGKDLEETKKMASIKAKIPYFFVALSM